MDSRRRSRVQFRRLSLLLNLVSNRQVDRLLNLVAFLRRNRVRSRQLCLLHNLVISPPRFLRISRPRGLLLSLRWYLLRSPQFNQVHSRRVDRRRNPL